MNTKSLAYKMIKLLPIKTYKLNYVFEKCVNLKIISMHNRLYYYNFQSQSIFMLHLARNILDLSVNFG